VPDLCPFRLSFCLYINFCALICFILLVRVYYSFFATLVIFYFCLKSYFLCQVIGNEANISLL
jgi:hypothetical protein